MIDETMEQASVQEAPVQDQSGQEATVEQKTVSSQAKEDNIRILRERAERAAKERDELARRIQQYESAQAKVESPDEDLGFKDDDLVEGKHLAKYAKRIKQLEEQQRQYMKQTSESTAEMKIRAQYSDFDKVVTQDNIQTFLATYPELAHSINSGADLYSKAVSAYTLIKKFGIYEESPFEAEKQKAAINTAKPRPLASVSPQQGESPLSRANAFAEGLTEDLKAQLRKEMEQSRRGY